MRFQFIDTCILTNLLRVPGKCQVADRVERQFRESRQEVGLFYILPVAAVIETGNHIANLTSEYERKICALRLDEMLRASSREDFPWRLASTTWDAAFLELLVSGMDPRRPLATRLCMGMGVGDLSILAEMELFRKRLPKGHVVKLWTIDSDFGSDS